MNADDFRTVVRKAQAGDRPAIDHLFGLALPVIERAAGPAARPPAPGESVSDLCQEAARRILERLGQFRGAEEAADDAAAWALFCAWVQRVVNTVRLNRLRRPGRGVVSCHFAASRSPPPHPEPPPRRRCQRGETTAPAHWGDYDEVLEPTIRGQG